MDNEKLIAKFCYFLYVVYQALTFSRKIWHNLKEKFEAFTKMSKFAN